MEGQAEKQPTESVSTLDNLAAMFDDIDPPEVEAEIDTETDELDDANSDEQEGELEAVDEVAPESDTATVILKHEGKEVKVSAKERDSLAEKGFDYTKKTMALADERKALEPIREQAKQKLSEYEGALNETLQRLNTVADFISQDLGEAPDIALASYDANTYIVQKAQHEARLDKLRATYGQIQQVEQERDRQRQTQLYAQANETQAYLVENLPGWKEAPEKSLDELNTYIKGYGLSPESTKEAYVQKGLWEIAHKAREYDKLKAAQSKLQPKATLPKVIAQGNNQVANVRQAEARKRFNAKPTLDSLAALMPDF